MGGGGKKVEGGGKEGRHTAVAFIKDWLPDLTGGEEEKRIQSRRQGGGEWWRKREQEKKKERRDYSQSQLFFE